MGLMSFIKDAGSKLFGGGKEASVVEPSVEVLEAVNTESSDKLKQLVTNMAFNVTDFNVEMSNDEAVLRGRADTQATREKLVLLVGNTAGISLVDDQMTVEQEQEVRANFHTVSSGDTLGMIAKHYYGNAGKYNLIFDANKPMLEHPDKIYPGQVLRIPTVD